MRKPYGWYCHWFESYNSTCYGVHSHTIFAGDDQSHLFRLSGIGPIPFHANDGIHDNEVGGYHLMDIYQRLGKYGGFRGNQMDVLFAVSRNASQHVLYAACVLCQPVCFQFRYRNYKIYRSQCPCDAEFI